MSLRNKMYELRVVQFVHLVSAQQDVRIAPLAIDLESIDLLEMAPLNNKDLIREEMELRKPGRPNHFAHTFYVDKSTQEIGKWTSLPDGSIVWRLRIHSNKAESLNLGFSKYKMPAGGTLVMYTPDFKNILGPFTPADNEEHEELWTPVVDGDDLIVEVWLKENNRNNFELELKSVNHDFIGINSASFLSGSCNLDVICTEADGWGIIDEYRDIIQSVALTQLNGNLNCTGFLVNNTAEDCTPLFMTANHCELTASNAPSLVTYWNYENSTCRQPDSIESGQDGDGTLNDFNTGSVWRAAWTPSDFTIVELDDPVNPSAEAYRAGWNATEDLASNVIGIHQPSRDEKRISFENDPVSVGDWNGSNTEDHIVVADWEIGTTEGGSSGSPLFDQNKRVVGQLHGGNAACGNDGSDSYGWFNTSWEGGGTPSSRLKDWLDPIDSGLMTIAGNSCGFTLIPDNSLVEICAPSDAVYQLTVSDNFTDNVNVTILNLPTGLSATFSNNTPAPGEMLSLTLSNTESLPFGNYLFAIDVTDGVEGSTTNLSLELYDGVPAMASLTTPADMSTNIPVTPIFEWGITSASTYEIEVATDLNFTDIVIANPIVDSETFTSNSFLDSETTYFWRIRGNNLCGTGNWSTTQSFTTANIVCSSNTAMDLPIVIDDGPANTISSTIEIAAGGTISDLNVIDLEGTHTWMSDLTFTLESPEGTSVILISTSCGDDDNFNINFDDQGTGTIPCPFTDGGTYPPLNALGAFNGENPQGTWTLIVADDASGDGGSLDNWGLEICTVPEAVSGVEQLNAQHIEFFPNPTQGNLTISLAHPFDGLIQGGVYHVNGSLLDNFKIPSGQQTHKLDLSNFPAGIYIVKLKHSDFIVTNKVILN